MGCSSIRYVNEVTFKAGTSIRAAAAAGADTLAPYWYTLAVLYQCKARKEAARANFQAANHFGSKAYQAAVEARKRARAVRSTADKPKDERKGVSDNVVSSTDVCTYAAAGGGSP